MGYTMICRWIKAKGRFGSEGCWNNGNGCGMCTIRAPKTSPDEMRVIACGTGMPNARPKQAAACWLVELGNGDKFIFDIGTGSAERLSALKIPYDFLDKVFIGHLHSDHFGDMDALWIGGVVGNRVNPMRVWGPAGHKPEYGTAYAMEHMQKMYTWDIGSRLGNVDIAVLSWR